MTTYQFIGWILQFYIFEFGCIFKDIYTFKRLLLEVSCSRTMMKKIKKEYTLKQRFFLIDLIEKNKYNAKFATGLILFHRAMIYVFFMSIIVFLICFFNEALMAFIIKLIFFLMWVVLIYKFFVFTPIYRKEKKGEHFFTRKDRVTNRKFSNDLKN